MQGHKGSGADNGRIRLGMLLPITSRGCSDLEVLEGSLERLAGSLVVKPAGQAPSAVEVVVLLGIDCDDTALLQRQARIEGPFRHAAAAVHTNIFKPAGCSHHCSQDEQRAVSTAPGWAGAMAAAAAAVTTAGDTGAAAAGLNPSPSPGATGAASICSLWSLLTDEAVHTHGCQLVVLLGDDTRVEPGGWPSLVAGAFCATPSLACLLLNDTADPGFPSFPVLRADVHLSVFGSMLPPLFVNQGGDPFLAELYRRVGATCMLAEVHVMNAIGGVQHPGAAYTQPRYERVPVPHQQLLPALAASCMQLRSSIAAAQTAAAAAAAAETAAAVVAAAANDDAAGADGSSRADVKVPAVIKGTNFSCALVPVQQALAAMRMDVASVDVLVPCYRVLAEVLEQMEDAITSYSGPPADIHWVIVVDNPSPPPHANAWLAQLQQRLLHRVRIRRHAANCGASATRNHALDESLAEWVVLWDDDVCPEAGCLAAYVAAFKAHPQAIGFAGPSFLPNSPHMSTWGTAVHLSDVSFFWSAPAAWGKAEVPWAVTANMAARNTPLRFDVRFPKTGGGEDIDHCLRLAGGHMVAVPEAAVHHPWWRGGCRDYKRFWGWAVGDGALLDMYPSLAYRSWPSATELGVLLAAAAAAAGALWTVTAATLWAAACLYSHCGGAIMAPAPGLTAGSTWAPTGYSTLDLLAGVMAAAAAIARRAALCGVAIRGADMLLDVWRNCCLQERVAKFPGQTAWRRPLAAAESNAIKTASELGRLWGHWARAGMGAVVRNAGRRFDWFCGAEPGVVASERLRALLCCGGYACAVLLACGRLGAAAVAGCAWVGLVWRLCYVF